MRSESHRHYRKLCVSLCYLTPAAYREAFGKEPSYQLLYAKLSDTSDEAKDRLTQTLLENKEVMSLTFTADLVETLDDTFDRLNLIVFVLIISASLLAFVVLYNLTNINITERVREIATIKVLGFYDREVDAYIFRENIILTIVGTAIGTFLGILHASVRGPCGGGQLRYVQQGNFSAFLSAVCFDYSRVRRVGSDCHASALIPYYNW